MNPAASRRSLIVWALYLCVLLNVLACGLGHGQALGLALNGLGGGFCGLINHNSASQAKQDGLVSASEQVVPFVCPACSASFLVLLFLIGVAWLLLSNRHRLSARELPGQGPPRHCWPSINPRASPRPIA